MEVELAGRSVGPGQPPFLLAAGGVDHRGERKAALEIVHAAAGAGADGLTFQHVRGPRLSGTLGAAPGQVARSAPPCLPDEDLAAVLAAARAAGLRPGLVAAEDDVVARAVSLGAAFLKVVSSEVPNLPLLAAMGRTRLPILLNTGGCALSEVAEAVETLQAHGTPGIVLLHTGPRIPCPPEEAGLSRLQHWRAAFALPVGYSDRCAGDTALVVASALGADLLEKHLRLPGPAGPHGDIGLEPAAWAEAARRARAARAMCAAPKTPTPWAAGQAVRRSVVALRPIAAGAVLRAEDLALQQPGGGLPPRSLPYLVGRTARRPIAAGQPLTPEDVGMEPEARP